MEKWEAFKIFFNPVKMLVGVVIVLITYLILRKIFGEKEAKRKP